MEDKKLSLDELSEKVLEGMRKAIRKMVEKKAANNGSLVIGDNKGGFKEVPAKELLQTLEQQ
jgi:20S proteasome alpha/beta subunit